MRSLKIENQFQCPLSWVSPGNMRTLHIANVKYRIRLAGIVRRFVCTYVLVCVW